MELKDVMLKRRSIRKYKGESISDDMINQLLHYAMSGPSACNKRPWHFYVITNEDVLVAIEKSGRYTKHHSPLKIIVCGDLEKALPKQMAEYWIQDCSSAIENILLGVTDMGLGACWEGAYPQEIVVYNLRKILSLPSHHIPLGIISIGFPDEEQEERDQYEEYAITYVK